MEVSRPASPMGAGRRQLLPLPCLLQDSHLCSWRRLFPPVPGGPQLPRGVWESRVNSVRSLPHRQSGENWRGFGPCCRPAGVHWGAPHSL